MSYRTPEHRLDMVAAARDALLASRRAIITTHINADGDGAGSQVALASWMRANGSEAWIVNPTPFPDMFRWMLDEPRAVLTAGSTAARDRCAAADLAVAVDTGEMGRIGGVRQLIRGLPTLVIDHHPLGGRQIGGISFRDPSACAAGELIYDILLAADGPWTQPAVLGIYVAIMTDTGSFRFDNSSTETHLIVADLIRRGVRPGDVGRRLYGSAPLRRFALLRASLGTLQSEEGVTWMTVPNDAYTTLRARPDDLEGLVDIPRSVSGTEVGVLFRLTKKGDVKVSFRSAGEVNVNQLARGFAGGGHAMASGAVLPPPLDAAVERVLSDTKAAVRASRGGREGGDR